MKQVIKHEPLEIVESLSSGKIFDSNIPTKISYVEENVIPKADRHKVIADCPDADVIFGNIKVRCLLDSGSQVTTITESFYNKTFRNKELKDCTWIRLNGSNGLPIPIIGIFITTLIIDKNKFDDVYVLVVKDPVDYMVQLHKIDVPGVIGCNVFQRMHANWKSTSDHAFAAAVHRYEAQIILSEQISSKMSDDDTGVLGMMKTSVNGICIPANTEMSITGTTNQSLQDHPVLIEPADVPLPDGLLVIPAIDNVNRGTVRCRVM